MEMSVIGISEFGLLYFAASTTCMVIVRPASKEILAVRKVKLGDLWPDTSIKEVDAIGRFRPGFPDFTVEWSLWPSV